MIQWEKVKNCLNEKLRILEKIEANTETQSRFIQKRKMIGLKRILRERAALIQKLAAVNKELSIDQSWGNIMGLKDLIQEIHTKQQKIIQRSREVLQQAVVEKTLIANELKNSKTNRKVTRQYVDYWVGLARGYRFDKKG